MKVFGTLMLFISLGAAFDVFDYVDPLIGTLNGGHVFPGATLPFGMAKAVADSKNPNDGQGGFTSDDSPILGFSHMHDSGTGGAPSMGNFPIFPQTGCAGDLISNCFFTKDDRSTSRVNGSVEAHPGYFALTLNTSIRAEIAVTNHTALYRFTFPSPLTNTTSNNTNQTLPYFPLILVELTDLQDSVTNGQIEINNTTGRLSGNGTFTPSFGVGTYNLSFCIDFSGAEVRKTGLWYDISTLNHKRSIDNPAPLPAGGWTQFHPPVNNQLLARVGISFISTSQACHNAETEIATFNFSAVLSAAETVWRDRLSVIELDATGVSTATQKSFWSGVYRSMISPQDYMGENPLWESAEPYFDSFYCIWDGFRSTFPLLTILDPGSMARMVRSLIDVYRFEGYLPDCRMSLCKGFTQGGSNADVVLADAFLKGITEGVNWTTAYEAVLKDAEVQSLDWTTQGRGGLQSWKTLGYIPTDDWDPWGGALRTRSISRTVEYAYNDFCLHLLSPLSPTPSNTSSLYLSRSKNWKNLFSPTQTSPTIPSPQNFTGFLQPRFLNGSFDFQDPALCSPLLNSSDCSLNAEGHETYEGSVWLYTFYAPHSMASLITLLGGPAAFVARLKYLHTSGLLYVGNEQAFLTIYQFHYAGRPGLSSYFSRYYIPSRFNDTIGGVAGNDDSGAMGAFTVLAMMGLWPVAGQDVYLITPPYFPQVKVRNGVTGKVATIKCENFEGEGRGNIYIQSARLDGEIWERNWLGHRFWVEGGTLELVLGSGESAWGTREEDLPPSY
ncbi:glycoside hydrolase family 92 protein [Stipitochalara longipes BDJ]|nr:glycoside hydrolase family 92 protein [Stipitochalara longipes BDJ]